MSINNSEVIFVQADLISAVGAIYLSLLRANRAIIHHHIIEADLRRVLHHCFQMTPYVIAVSFAGLGHQVCDEDLGGVRSANGIGNPGHNQVWNDTGVQRAGADSNHVG